MYTASFKNISTALERAIRVVLFRHALRDTIKKNLATWLQKTGAIYHTGGIQIAR